MKQGKPNKVMAADLGLSQRTVEIHRSHVMEKMGANSIAQLVRMVLDTNASTVAPSRSTGLASRRSADGLRELKNQDQHQSDTRTDHDVGRFERSQAKETACVR